MKKTLAMLLVIVVALPTIAFVYSQTQSFTSTEISNVLVVRYAIAAQFGVYWDYECTKPITTIDFGEIPLPRNYMSIYKTIYIRNEQPDERIFVYWNSTLPNVTTKIYESWIWNGTTIEPNYVYGSGYSLQIQSTTPIGTYQWTLGIWAEY